MGEFAQRRIIRKLDLELFLSKIKPQPTLKASLEQYTISESIPATLLHIATYTNNDIVGKNIIDLGCGTGRLALGAGDMGAENQSQELISTKIPLRIAAENARELRVFANTQFVVGDISTVKGDFDTALQNPPLGSPKTRGADRAFLVKA